MNGAVFSAQDVERLVKLVEFRNWVVIVEEVSDDIKDGFTVQWVFRERDNMHPEDEMLYPQHCRKWLVECGASSSSVIKTLYLAAQQAVMHEFQEQFWVGGKPLLDPHASVNL